MRLMEIDRTFQVWYRTSADTGMAAHRLIIDAPDERQARRAAREQLDAMFMGKGWRITSVVEVE